jgi:hypothetical protein
MDKCLAREEMLIFDEFIAAYGADGFPHRGSARLVQIVDFSGSYLYYSE